MFRVTFLFFSMLLSFFCFGQKQKKDCRLDHLACYANSETDTVVVKGKYHSLSMPGVFAMLDTLNKKGLLKKSDYKSAIVFWVDGCKENFVPLYTTGWYPDAKFNANKNHGKEYSFTCVFYKGYSDRKQPFFTVLKME